MKNWKTSLVGIVSGLVIAGPEILHIWSGAHGDWRNITLGSLAVLAGALAKDFNVTNSPNPVQPAATNNPPVRTAAQSLFTGNGPGHTPGKS